MDVDTNRGMDRLKRTTLAALPLVLLLLAAPSPAAAEDQLIIGFKEGTPVETQKRIIARADGSRRKRLAGIRGQVVKPRRGVRFESLRGRLLRNPDVAYVERDVELQPFKMPNDPLFGTQYSESPNGQIDTGTTDAWNTKTSCSKVAVLDTGIDTDHPDLTSNVWKNKNEKNGNGKDDDKNGYVDDYYGINLIKGKGNGEDDNGHGTHVAGIVAGRGNNSTGIAGVCWSGKVMALKFMSARGSGFTSDAVEGIEYAIDMGAKIVNASFGSSTKSEALADQVERARDKGVLIVAAAGNDGKDIDKSPVYPASYTYSNLLVVAASTATDGRASFSNYGAVGVDLAAPGERILSTYLGGSYRTLDGTSMAAPMVSGVAALCRARNGDASYKTIRSAIRGQADAAGSFSGKSVSGGRVNVARALANIPED